MTLSLRALIALSILFLSACRMPVFIDGKGFVFGEYAGVLYSHGYLFEINEDFQEVFWPVPAPGYSFTRWTDICSSSDGPCELNIGRQLWQLDEEMPLRSRYKPGYRGPLELLNYDLYWNAATRTLSIPADSLAVAGVHPNDSPRLFMAPADLGAIVPGVRVGNDYRFRLADNDYSYRDYWLFVSAVDSNGVIASASFNFGLADQVRARELRPHSGTSPWGDVLVGCVSANNPFGMCKLETLPFLGSSTTNPTVSDVLKRTVVSHGWMGVRFAEVLKNLPPEMLKLFRGVTAVVIGSRIRPAFYISTSGAIYLDPQDLWLTPQERSTINWEPDYRAGFGGTVNFISAELYVAGNRPAWFHSSLYEDWESRSLNDIIWPMANLLAHELAHANDAMPPSLLPLVSAQETPLDAIFRFEEQSPSQLLVNTYPLRSQVLLELADVLFRGEPMSSLIASLEPYEVGLEFENDDANALYGYSTPYEDTAMLVEEVLTRYYFRLDRIVSFLEVPLSENPDCTEYTLRWGVRNRAATPTVRARAELVLRDILDEADVSRYLDSLPDTEDMRRGIGLCESLTQSSGTGRTFPGRFIRPTELAHLRAMQVNTHRQVRERAGRGRVRRIIP